MKNGQRNNQITGSILLMAAVLLAIGSFYDLEISTALAGKWLPAGKYYTVNRFALFIEMSGFSLIYLFGAVATAILFVAVARTREGDRLFIFRAGDGKSWKLLKSALLMLSGAGCVYEAYSTVHEYFDYPQRFLKEALLMEENGLPMAGNVIESASQTKELVSSVPGTTWLQAVLAALLAVLLILCFYRLRKEVVDRLVQVAVVILIAILFYTVMIEAIKGPAGRVRFRTMNVIGDFSEYTPWYVFRGSRVLSRTGELAAGTLSAAERFLGLSDTCKSFPSGHTYAAAVSYAALCLPDLFPDMRRTGRAACFLVPTLLTVIVGLGRVMAGAHFLTDVVIGGLAAYLIVMVARWGIRKLWSWSRQEDDHEKSWRTHIIC